MVETKSDIIKQFIYKKNINYVIYVKDTISTYEFYLQNEDYGVISLMFGIPKCDIKDMKNIILTNIEDYIETYKEQYED